MAIKTTINNKRARTDQYISTKSSKNTNIFSRTMGISGSIILFFIITHLSTFWYQFQISNNSSNYYNIVIGDKVGFGNPIYSILYIISIIILGFHLKHGFLSAFQTLGVNNQKLIKILTIISALFWLLVPLGFISIPLYFGFIKGNL